MAIGVLSIVLCPAPAHAQIAHQQIVRICKSSTPGNPVTGTFTFTIDVLSGTSAGAQYTLSVPVGPCPAGLSATNWLFLPFNALVRITEQAQANTSVAAITVSGGTVSSTNLANRQVTFSVGPFGSVVTFRNQGPEIELGRLKLCKVAGRSTPLGTPFAISATPSGGAPVTYTVPAGPAPGGYCVLAGTFPVGSEVHVVDEASRTFQFDLVSWAVRPMGRYVIGSFIAEYDTFSKAASLKVTIGSGVTEVSFTNRCDARLPAACR